MTLFWASSEQISEEEFPSDRAPFDLTGSTSSPAFSTCAFHSNHPKFQAADSGVGLQSSIYTGVLQGLLGCVLRLLLNLSFDSALREDMVSAHHS